MSFRKTLMKETTGKQMQQKSALLILKIVKEMGVMIKIPIVRNRVPIIGKNKMVRVRRRRKKRANLKNQPE